jgi:hypothetical protein
MQVWINAARADPRKRWAAFRDGLYLSNKEVHSAAACLNLCDSFALYFASKIRNIKTASKISARKSQVDPLQPDPVHHAPLLSILPAPSVNDAISVNIIYGYRPILIQTTVKTDFFPMPNTRFWFSHPPTISSNRFIDSPQLCWVNLYNWLLLWLLFLLIIIIIFLPRFQLIWGKSLDEMENGKLATHIYERFRPSSLIDHYPIIW